MESKAQSQGDATRRDGLAERERLAAEVGLLVADKQGELVAGERDARPDVGAFVVAGWLAGIIINLLTKNPPEYYDIALRDFGLMLAALTLGRLSLAVVPARKSGLLPRRPW